MEALVVKVLKKHFKLFIKNFNADQLSISAMKGEGQMTDLDLNEKVIQELLYIPMNLEVTKASCDLLNMKVPWTSLSSKPITLTLNRVDIDLREPTNISARTSLIKGSDKPKGKSDAADNMQIIINNVHMTIQTLGGALIMMDLDDILIQSTNNKWEVVDLSKAVDINKETGIESLHKKLTVRSINLAVLTEKAAHMVLQQTPLKIQFTSKRRTKDWTLISGELEFILEKINFRWTQPELLLMVELIEGFQACLSRPVPKLNEALTTDPASASASAPSSAPPSAPSSAPPSAPSSAPPSAPSSTPGTPKAEHPVSPKPEPAKAENAPKAEPTKTEPTKTEPAKTEQPALDVSYKLRIETWSVDFVEQEPPNEKGYSFFGDGLSFIFNSSKVATVQQLADSATNTPAAAVEVEETVISTLVNTVKFRELVPRELSEPFIVTQKNSSLQASDGTPAHLLKASLTIRRPTSNVTQVVPIIGIEFAIALSNLQIVAHRKTWKALIRYFASTDQQRQKKAEEKAGKELTLEDAKNTLNQLKDRLKLTENWQNQIKVGVKASDLRVIIPGETHGEYQGIALHLDLGNFSVSNFSDWKVTPNLHKGMAILTAPLPCPPITMPRVVGLPHKLSFLLEGVAITVHSSGKTTPILQPASVHLFVHYFERAGRVETDKGKPQLEVVLYSGEFNLQANEKQFSYLNWVGKKYLDPRKMADVMNARVKQVKDIAEEKLKEFKDATPATEYVKPIKEKVTSALEAYKWTVYVHIDKGVFKVPLTYFIAPDAASTQDAIFDPLANPSTAAGAIIEGDIDNPCELKFEHLDLALENSINGQGVVVQLGTFTATGLDHPKLPSTVTLVPLIGNEEERLPEGIRLPESLVFRYKHKRKPTTGKPSETTNEDEFITEVFGRLQRVHVKIAKKKGHPGFNTSGMGLPDIQGMVNRAVSLIQERKDQIEAVKANVKQIDFDMKWGVELGGCEVSLEEGDSSSGQVVFKPYGQVRLADASRPILISAYKDMEAKLVAAKLANANNEVEKDEKQTQLLQAQSALAKSQQEYQSLEMKMVQLKMAMAQMQEQNDNLLSQQRVAKK